jgi:uncharacterized membrane protein YecN with MAPEG domain
MERIRNLDRYQKLILLLVAVMLVGFTVAYAVVSAQVGFIYMDSVLYYSNEGETAVYAGTIEGVDASFTVTADKAVTFRYGNKTYGPYTAKEDTTAIPEAHPFGSRMTGIEIRCGEDVFFRGGVVKDFYDGVGMMLFDEEGKMSTVVNGILSDGTVIDSDGNVVDPMIPSAVTILQMIEGPELRSNGNWIIWLCGTILAVCTAVSILFVDELFRWELSFRVRDADLAEPSDWELIGRYIAWTILPVSILAIYIIGLHTPHFI